MWSEEGRELSGEEVRKPVKRRKKATKPIKASSALSRVQLDTNLSRQYDNDGNPYPTEPKGYTADGGH